MRIIGAYWTRVINYLVIECECGICFKHRVDRWVTKCPDCGKKDNLRQLRQRWISRFA